MSRRIHASPPIDEATCQFALAVELSWDNATPSRLFEYAKRFYPGMPEQQQLVQANLSGSCSRSCNT